jgi:opacity protein-like surface antigen
VTCRCSYRSHGRCCWRQRQAFYWLTAICDMSRCNSFWAYTQFELLHCPLRVAGGQHLSIDRTYSVMGNLFYDFKLGRIQPFIGAGAGWAHLDVDTNFTGFNFIQARGTDDRFAYQLMAGVAVPLGETVSLTARYTYFDTVGDKMTALNGSGAGTSVSVDLPYSNHSVTIGLRFGF